MSKLNERVETLKFAGFGALSRLVASVGALRKEAATTLGALVSLALFLGHEQAREFQAAASDYVAILAPLVTGFVSRFFVASAAKIQELIGYEEEGEGLPTEPTAEQNEGFGY